MKFKYNEEVTGALHFESPIVALESTVIAHGLPYPENIETAYKLERIIRDNGAVPATVGVFDGEICVGLNEDQFEMLATSKEIRKISHRDLPVAVSKKLNCATTVATTAFIAHRAGIKVFATGGIGARSSYSSALRMCPNKQFFRQPRLANPSLPRHADKVGTHRLGAMPHGLQSVQFLLTTD